MTALKLGLQDPNSDVASAALLALGETCAVLEVNYSSFSFNKRFHRFFFRVKFQNIQFNFYLY